MKFQMIHEVRDRIHVRCLSAKGVLFRGFDARQGAVILSRLERISGVYKVKLYSASGEVAITFAPDKRASLRPILLDTLAYLDPNDPGLQKSSKHQADALILNRTYRNRLISHVTRHFACKWFLPMPVRMLRAWYHTLGFIRKGVKSLLSGKLDVPVLDATAITAAMLQNDLGTAGSIMLLLGIGDILEEWTLKKSVHDLASHMSINVDTAWKVLENGTEIEVPLTEVEKGDVISVKMGSTIPLDGLVTGGEALVNQASMTGESMPVRKTVDGTVFAGTVVEDGEICIRVTGTVGDTRFDRIVKIIEDSEAFKSNLEGRANHLADRLVPWCLGGTLLTYLITRNVMKAMAVLMVDFSCALKLSMPLAVLSAMRECSTYKITVKGGKFLEAVAEADTIVFDKTGTLTKAQPTVAKIVSFNDQSEDELLRIAACLEEHFPHSMAKAVVREAVNRNLVHEELHSKVEYIVAHGISSKIGEKHIVIGSYHFVFEDENATIPEGKKEIFEQLPEQYSHLYMAIDGVLVAVICIEDPLRPEAVEVIAKLKKLGISKVVMMTGDSDRVASAIAKKVGVDEYHSEVLPEDKASFVEAEKNAGRKVIMVGDGINDSPALSAADVGIAISDGAEIAREIADVTVGADDLHELVTLKKISNGLMERIHRNYRLIVGINTSLIVLGVAGAFPPTTSALLHNTSTLLISLKSMNNLLDEKEEVTEENVAEAFA